MKRIVVLALLAAGVQAAFAAPRHLSFQAKAAHAVLMEAKRGVYAFSPVAFEIDCAYLTEAFDKRTKPKTLRNFGVIESLDTEFAQMAARFAQPTNGLSMRSYRMIGTRRFEVVSANYRGEMARKFDALCYTGFSMEGAKAWAAARIGVADAEKITLPPIPERLDRVVMSTLGEMRFTWHEPFPTANSRKIVFTRADGTTTNVEAICDARVADLMEQSNMSVLRLPAADDSWFFAVMPKNGCTMKKACEKLDGDRAGELLSEITSIVNPAVTHSAVAIVLPRMDVTAAVDMGSARRALSIPDVGFAEIKAALSGMEQRMRFVLDGRGLDGETLAEKPVERQIAVTAETKRFVANRPFFFFIHHVPTDTLPIVGFYNP